MAIELSAVRYRYAGASAFALAIDRSAARAGPRGRRRGGQRVRQVDALPGGVRVRAACRRRAAGGIRRSRRRRDHGARPHELAQRCGLLFQNAATQLSNTTATVFEEVGFGPCNLGLPVAEVVERVWWALGAVGIDELAPRDPARLSGGEGQLVALASVLALRPRYLILDEPTSELDPAGTRLVADALARVAAETGAGVLIVEHKTDVLERIADGVVVLERGAVALAGQRRRPSPIHGWRSWAWSRRPRPART